MSGTRQNASTTFLQRNIHAHTSETVSDNIFLAISYVPNIIVVIIISFFIYGYFFAFLGDFLSALYGDSYWRILPLYLLSGAPGFVLVVTSYYRCCFTSPGYVSANPWATRPELVHDPSAAPRDHDHFVASLTPKREFRYCHKCLLYKPDDAHHCSQCQKCVLRMDHHCPWVNNCVGRDNTKYFILFLSYISFECTVIMCQTSFAFFNSSINTLKHKKFINGDPSSEIATLMLLIVSGMFSIFIGCFAAVHIFNLCNNTTTIGPVVDHLPIGGHFDEVFGHPDSIWEHFIPIPPKGRRARNQCQPGICIVQNEV
eukprot:Tbor_TRINITY_DN4312_c0_g1::TRINITY_DN4312_c0_g1_i1::g.7689::m.7689/K20028/ZDHHC2_15_20; palmitoyltransferase ZDHHC2/15/20